MNAPQASGAESRNAVSRLNANTVLAHCAMQRTPERRRIATPKNVMKNTADNRLDFDLKVAGVIETDAAFFGFTQ